MNDADEAWSVLLATVAGCVQRHQRLDDAEAGRVVERCLKRMERAVESFGGHLLCLASEELMARFERPDLALEAARAMQQRVAELPPQVGVKLAIRVGVAHGSLGEECGGYGGAAVSIAAHLAGLADPGQVLFCGEARSRLSTARQEMLRECAPPSATTGLNGVRVFAVGSLRATAFRLNYGEQSLAIDEPGQVIHIGRDAQSDVRIRDRRASRHHARIERRGDQVYLVDHSSNGSYVTTHGESELFVRGGECLLHGRGVICFAASADRPGADCAQFAQAERWPADATPAGVGG